MLIPKMIGYFKMNSGKHVNQLRDVKGISLWQRNYYEHVVRNEPELYRIREYIQNNPLKWESDIENRDHTCVGSLRKNCADYYREVIEGH